MKLESLFLRYAGFAVVAIIFNLVTQRIVLLGGSSLSWYVAAVGAGTLVGLVIKYILDKRWIFYDIDTSFRSHSEKFTLYSVTGVITTVIFWGTESVFWFIWQTDTARELGAILGLSTGYVIKFNLDRRFVFNDEKS